MSILAIIPARKNSYRLKNKNLLKISKLSLVEISIKLAKNIKEIDDIIVSTDSNIIKKISEKEKVLCPWLRPKSLSGSKISSEKVVMHALKWYEKNIKKVKTIILLQPTSPLRKIFFLKKAINIFKKKKMKSLYSVYPYFYAKKFMTDGSLYIIKVDYFKKYQNLSTLNSQTIESNSLISSLDVNNYQDYMLAKFFAKKYSIKNV
jgi:CMP-N-acetylneuraminic acid synthetase